MMEEGETAPLGQVAGVNLALVNEAVLDKYLIHFDLHPDDDLGEKVAALASHIESETDSDDLCDCQECGAPNTTKIDVCVFCGTADDEGGEESEEPDAPAPEEEKPEEPMARAETPKPKAKPKAAPKVAKPKAKPKAKAAPKTNGKSTNAKAKKAAAAVVETTGESAEVAVAKLDSTLEEIRAIQAETVSNMWRLGRKLLEIYGGQLHLTRMNDAGKPAYNSWSKFVKTECNIDPRFSYKLMDIASSFTQDDVSKVGVSKLSVMVQLDDAERTKLLAKVKDEDMPFSRVSDEVRRLAAGKPARKTGRAGMKSPAGKATEASRKAAAKKRADGEKSVTVVQTLGRTSIKLYKTDKKNEQPKRAKRLADKPHGEEPAVNGIRTTYKVVERAQGLEIVIERLRA